MSKTFHQQIAGSMRVIQSNRGEPVTYTRGTSTCQFVATCSPKPYEAIDADGLLITFHSHDWLIVSADLVLDDVATVPALDDTITTAAGEVHRVMLIPGRNCYDSGPGDVHFRVHTKIVPAPTETET